MKAVIEATFPQCLANGCVVETQNETVLIQDAVPGKCIIIDNEEEAHFTVKNLLLKQLTFVAIDKCVWNDQSGHKKCDFAITDSSSFAFVEIKDTENDTDDRKSKAILQLEESIKKFQAKIDFSQLTCKAIIAFRWQPTRPLASSTIQSASLRFWNNYSVDLFEGNELQF